eukprot:3240375-Rhodomonas_salina.1
MAMAMVCSARYLRTVSHARNGTRCRARYWEVYCWCLPGTEVGACGYQERANLRHAPSLDPSYRRYYRTIWCYLSTAKRSTDRQYCAVSHSVHGTTSPMVLTDSMVLLLLYDVSYHTMNHHVSCAMLTVTFGPDPACGLAG